MIRVELQSGHALELSPEPELAVFMLSLLLLRLVDTDVVGDVVLVDVLRLSTCSYLLPSR
jgi:hypothetical protein